MYSLAGVVLSDADYYFLPEEEKKQCRYFDVPRVADPKDTRIRELEMQVHELRTLNALLEKK